MRHCLFRTSFARRVAFRVPALLLGAMLATSCSLWPDGEFPPGGSDRIDERPEYLMWWKLVESCSHVHRRMDVQWYTTNGRYIDYGDILAQGVYRPWPDRIALANPASGPVARHEMLHAIMQKDGHPLDQFAGTCDGYVNFTPPENFGISARELAEAVTIRSDSALAVTVSTYPEKPSLSQFGGNFVFIVTATNKTGRSVWVPTQNGTLNTQYRDLSTIRFQTGSLPFTNVFFRSGQSRQVLVDAKVFTAGTFDAFAIYGRARSATIKLTLQP